MSYDPLSSTLTQVETLVGQPMTLQKKTKIEYQTSNGTTVYDKILTGYRPILFPTAVSRNSCFEYRFSIKDVILPRELPQVTDLYFKDLVVKIQDLFTEVQQKCIENGLIYSYMPYSAVLAQDEDGVSTESHVIDGKEQHFVNADRIIKRDTSPLYVVSSNIKFSRSFNLDIATNSYKALAIYNNYDSNGKLTNRFSKPVVSATPEELRDIQENLAYKITKNPKLSPGRPVCVDIILCDVFIFCLKSFDLDSKFITSITAEEVDSVIPLRTLPMGWLTPEEKLEKFGKKGTYMETFDTNNPLPNNLFQFVDMQTRSEKLFTISRPKDAIFDDVKGVVAPFRGQYVVANEMISIKIKSDN